MKRLLFIAALALTLIVSGIGCNSTVSEFELKTIGEFYVVRIEEFYSTRGRYPMDLDELSSIINARETRKINPKRFAVSYVLIDENSKPYFAFIIGDILADGRELHFRSDSKDWYFDS